RQTQNTKRTDNDDLAAPSQLDEHWRNVSLRIIEHFPNRRACHLVVGGDRLAVSAPGKHDHFVVHDERRSSHGPGKVLRLVVRENVLAPYDSAAVGIETAQLASGAERVDAALVPGRRRAWSIAGRVIEFSVPLLRPELAAVVYVVSRDDFLAATLFDRVRLAIGNDERSMSDANRLFPKHRQSVGRPVGGDTGFLVLTVPLRSAEVGPVVP